MNIDRLCPDCDRNNTFTILTAHEGKLFCKDCGYYRKEPPYRISPRCGHIIPPDITDEMLLKKNTPCRYCSQESVYPHLTYLGLSIVIPLLAAAIVAYIVT